MSYEIKQTIFWQVAIKEAPQSGCVDLTKKQKSKFDTIVEKLAATEDQRIQLFAELRDVCGPDSAHIVDADLLALRGYASSDLALLYEKFTAAELNELNGQGILSEDQHYAVMGDTTSDHALPLDADRLMSRRELQRVTAWSNDKFTRYQNLDLDPLRPLIKSESNSPDIYSAFNVYRWMTRAEYRRKRSENKIIDDWLDANCFGDTDGRPPGAIEYFAYKLAVPELFNHAA